MEAITYEYLVAAGILFIGLEVFTFSFVLFFLGLGLIIVGGISYFYTFESAWVQLALASVLSLVLAYLLRDTLLKKISKPQTQEEQKTHRSGIGVIQDGAVKFDGSFWQTDDDISELENGQKVEVVDVIENKVVLKME